MNIESIFGRREAAVNRAVSDDRVIGSNIDFGKAAIGAGIGAGAGAVIGAVAAYSSARSDIDKVPTESVTLSWNEPNMQNANIGNIPHNQYFPASHWISPCDGGMNGLNRPYVNPDLRATDPVVRQVPILDSNGSPLFHDVTKTFTDHGHPVVSTQSHVVAMPQLQGFNQNVYDDTHWASCDDGRDSNGNRQTRTVTVLDGVRVTFSPQVKDVPVTVNGQQVPYDTKSVVFNSGVDVGGKVLHGALIGAGIGAVVGLVGDIARQTLASRNS